MRPWLNRRVLLVVLVAAVTTLLGAGLALAAATALILPTRTPGARYSKVTQATIATTICKSGWTKTIRPPASYTNALKKEQLARTSATCRSASGNACWPRRTPKRRFGMRPPSGVSPARPRRARAAASSRSPATTARARRSATAQDRLGRGLPDL